MGNSFSQPNNSSPNTTPGTLASQEPHQISSQIVPDALHNPSSPNRPVATFSSHPKPQLSPLQPSPAIKPSVFYVPRNARQILDFSHESPSPESQAMKALLSNRPNQNAIALVGMGGAGKTTILRALGRNTDVWTKFPDGVWFIELGHDASVQKLLEQLEDLVVDAFPDFVPKFTRLASKDSSHLGMMERLADLLTPKHFLLIFDDVWDLDSNVYNLIDSVCKAVQETDGVCCKVLTSTRNEAIGRVPTHDVSISVSPEHSSRERCLEILCCYAGINSHTLPTLSSANLDAVHKIIEFCAGLPLALSVAGSAMQDLFGRRKDGCGQDAIAQYWESLKKSTVQLSVAESGGRHVGLGAAIQSSLVSLEKKWTGKGMGMGEMFESFCIVQKQMILPLYVIEKLWDTIDGVPGVRMLSRHSLISLEQDEGGAVWGVRLHDLVHDMCVEMAEGREGVGKWHGRLVDGYLSWMGRRRSGRDEENEEEEWNGIGEDEWWKMDRTDKYMRDNVVRHLLGAGRMGAGLRLLSDYRWVEEMNEDKDRPPFRKVITELQQLEIYLETNKETETDRKLLWDMNIVARAMEVCALHCVKNRRECTFQLYGRLQNVESESGFVERILRSIEQYGRRPWGRAGRGVLKSGKSSLRRVLELEDDGKCMCVSAGGDEVIVGGKGGKVWILDGEDGSKKKTLVGQEDSESIVEVFVDRSSRVVYSCSRKGCVMVWREYKVWRSWQAAGLEEEETMQCMEVLRKLERVVLGTNQGRLFMIDMKNGSTIQIFTGHNTLVTSLNAGEKEDIVVSGLFDGTILIWDTASLKDTGTVFEGHADGVNSVVLSGDGRLLASGSLDGTVQISDAHTGEQLWTSKDGWWITSVLFSIDGRLLYGATEFGKIHVWLVGNLGRDVALLGRLEHPSMNSIKSLCIGHVSELFVLKGKRVHVWDAQRFINDESVDKFLPHVSVFAISQDGATMLTWQLKSRLLEIRNVYDVSQRIDRVILSCHFPSGDRHTTTFAVSNNQRVVASANCRSCIVRVLDAQSGNVLHSFSDLEYWALCTLRRHVMSTSGRLTVGVVNEAAKGIESLRFNTDGSMISADACIKPLPQNPTIERKSLSWTVLSGEPLCDAQPNDDSTASKCAKVARLLCKKQFTSSSIGFTQNVTYERHGSSFTIATLEGSPCSAHYIPDTSRLLVSGYRGMYHIDLVTDDTQLPLREEPFLPREPQRRPPQLQNDDTEADEVYDVFISHAGTDKLTIAIPLYNLLVALGLKVFLDRAELRPGQNASQKMVKAMRTAKIAVVILSPEFVARNWTLKELMCFLERFRSGGERAVIIIPVFYRLMLNDCWNENTLFRLVNDCGENVFVAEGFLERMAGERKYGVGDVVKTLQSLRSITGIENKKRVTNGDTAAEKAAQMKFVMEIRDAVVEAMERLSSGGAAGASHM